MTTSDNFSSVVPIEHSVLHTAETPFCFDGSCPCHEDPENIAAVRDAVNDGLLTPDEATRLIHGQTI